MESELLFEKKRKLEEAIARSGSMLVAFSGGVDSSFLLAVAQGVLGDRVVAVTAISPVHPPREEKGAKDLAEQLGVAHIPIETDFHRIVSRENARLEIVERARKAGFDFVTLDLEGYRQGSMNVQVDKNRGPNRNKHERS